MTALEVCAVSKRYPLNDSPSARLRQVLMPGAIDYGRGLWALEDISFTVGKGEAFGIIGANGSGKSTLLQIVAGILQPTSGSVTTRGRLSALLELGSGFAPEFSGRQNVFLNAAILGLSRQEIEQRFEAIEQFAGIDGFIDQPIRTYSTGMVLRLAFAVAAHVDPEILIVDEALAVGDIAFRQRCLRRVHDLRASGTTILFVSHDTGDVKALCERSLWLEQGRVRSLGASDEVVAAYLKATVMKERARDARTRIRRADGGAKELSSVTGTHRYGNRVARVVDAQIEGVGQSPRRVAPGSSVVLRMRFEVDEHLPSPIAGFLVRNEKGETMFGSNTSRENYPLPTMAPGQTETVTFHWVMPFLATGLYSISIAISDGTLEEFEVCDYIEDAIRLMVANNSWTGRGYLRLPCTGITAQRG